MDKRYLLDTNVLSCLVRRPGSVLRKILSVGEDSVCTSIIVAAELRFGALKKKSPALSSRVNDLLDTLEVMPLDGEVDRIYAAIRARLESLGQPIGGTDYLIAAHALTTECTLVTDNVAEFRRVPELIVENWLR